jgi:hypothetical protein
MDARSCFKNRGLAPRGWCNQPARASIRFFFRRFETASNGRLMVVWANSCEFGYGAAGVCLNSHEFSYGFLEHGVICYER